MRTLTGVPQETQRWLARRSLRRTLTLLALLPLAVIISVKVGQFTGDPLLNVYGIAVLGSTMLAMYLSFVHYRDPSTFEQELTGEPLVSFLLAVKDDVEVIERCVLSLVEQTYGNIEIIVVDDGSTDGTGEVLAELARTRPIRVISMEHNVGKKRALTAGALSARGEFFAFTDSDCVVDSAAIERCLLAFQARPELGAVSGHTRALNADRNLLTRIQDVWYDGQFGISKAAESVFGSVTCVSGPLAVFRRAAIYNYLPAWADDHFLGKEFKFATDRQLTGYVLGQKWIGWRLKERYAESAFLDGVDYPARRWSVAYVRSARVQTNVPARMATMIKQQVRWKKSFIRNLFFTGRFYWRRGSVLALLFYSHVVFVVLAPALAFRHLIWLPAHGRWFVTMLYLLGILLKGSVWGLAYKVQNPRDSRWVLRPLMSLLSALVLSWLLIYAALTLRRNVWSRG